MGPRLGARSGGSELGSGCGCTARQPAHCTGGDGGARRAMRDVVVAHWTWLGVVSLAVNREVMPYNRVDRAVVGLVVKARHTLPTGRGFETRWFESTPRSGIRATGYPLSS